MVRLESLLPAAVEPGRRPTKPRAPKPRAPKPRANVLHARVVAGSGGGPDKTVLNSPRYLAPHGYRAGCVFLRHPLDRAFSLLEDKARQWQSPLVAIDDRGALDWRIAATAEALCREQDISIWHGHDYKTNLLGLWLRRRLPLRLVTTVHGWVDLGWKLRCYYALDRWALKRYDAIACVSEDLIEVCRGSGVSEERLHLLPNAIDCEEFRRRSLRNGPSEGATVDGQQGRLVVAVVGRLSPEKGLRDLLQAVKKVDDRGVALELRIAGDGRERQSLEQLTGSLGLAERVSFLGPLSDPRELYEAADLLVSSSLREGLPNVVLEAMAYELPVLATRVAGVSTAVVDGRTGFLVEPGDVEGLADRLTRLAADRGLRHEFGRAGRDRVENQFQFADRMERMVEIYDRVLAAAELTNGTPHER